MKVTIDKSELVIRIPLQKPTLSASGKTYVVATTRGNQLTSAVDPESGQPITIGLNAYVKAGKEGIK